MGRHSDRPRGNTIWNRNFICVMLANTCLTLSQSSVNTLVSTYATFLGAGAVLVGALTGMFFGVSFAMRPVSGPVTTKMDKRRLIILANVIGIVVNAGYAISGGIGTFVLFRVLNGVQYSLIGSLNLTIAGDSLPPEKMGSGLGIFGVGSAAALAVGPSIGIALRDFGTNVRGEAFGYTVVFIFACLIMVVSLIPSLLITPQKRTKEEIASTGVWYKNIIAPNAVPPAILIMLINVSMSLYNAYMVPYAASKNISGVGLFFTVYAICTVSLRPFTGRLVDRYGSYRTIMPGALIYAVSFVITSVSQSLTGLLFAAVVAAMGFSTIYPAIQTMCMQSVTPLKRAVASNTNFFGVDLGMFLGPFLGGIIYKFSDYSVMYLSTIAPIFLAMILLAVFWPGYVRRRQLVQAEMAKQSG